MVDTPTNKILHCAVVTPERALLDEPADYVVLPMYDGELGVLPGRLPLIGRLGFGELRLRRDGRVRRYFIDGGFAQVRANTVTVLTPRAQRAEDVNTTAASEALELALRPAATPEAQEAQLKDQERARAQLRVAHHAEGGQGGH